MKISKLFHWLYAVLMLLPVAFIAVRCGYVMFNKNAKDSYSDSYIEKLSKVTSSNQQIVGQTYLISFNNDIAVTSTSNWVYFSDTSIQWTNFNSNINYNVKAYRIHSSGSYIYLLDTSEVQHNVETTTTKLNQYMNGQTLVFTGGNMYDTTWKFNYYLLTYANQSLDNAFEYSVNQLNEVPLFSWAQTSFLVAPFSYITGLFGLASTSPINTLLSYWLSISIIWLVFDLVMYLPLLIHRWLDKGVLE